MAALLGAGPSAGARFAQQARAAAISLDRIWALADSHGRLRAAVLAVASPGRTTMLLATHPRDGRDASEIGRCVREACVAAEADTDLAQALVEPSRPRDVEAYEAGGLRALATLDYLECRLGPSWNSRGTGFEPPSPGWSVETIREVVGASDPGAISDATRRELCGVLEQSYLDTHDCPGLAGIRRTTDVLDGHFGTGARARIWLLARKDGAPAAVCLLNGASDRASAELVYLGVARDARGQGLSLIHI